jgi:thiol-disulfide isomerase/thioredoxin
MDSGRPKESRIWLALAVGFVVLWGLYLTFFGPKRRALLENSGSSQPADYRWQLVDLDDQPVSLSRFQGKTVFLNVWATWCGPCVQEMPSIAALAKNPRLKDRGVEFVCVSVDDSSPTVRQFLEGRDWSMTFLRTADQPTPAVFATDGIPATFLIDRNGRIAATTVGSAEWNEPEVVDFIDKLASAGPRTPLEKPKPAD